MFAVAVVPPPMPEGSIVLRTSFIALALFIAASFVAGVFWSATRSGMPLAAARVQALRAAGATTVWLALTGIAAARGALHFTAPPTMVLVFPILFATAIGIALSPVGRRFALDLPVAVLVGFQGFRVLVELVLHRAYTEGLMPVQMSYAGRNFDIVSGATAIAVALWLVRGHTSPRLVFAWNTLGAALLLNILIVALLSAPTPMRVFMNEPANVWVMRAPWIWLPTVMVFAAIMGHALVYRRLWLQRTAASNSATPVLLGYGATGARSPHT